MKPLHYIFPAILLFACVQVSAAQGEIASVLNRARTLLMPGDFGGDLKLDAADARNWMTTIGADGAWSDIDYADNQPGAWKTLDHLRRLRIIAREFADPSSELHKSADALNLIARALDHWAFARYKNPNWWQNEIGAPQVMRDILLLVGDELPSATREGAMSVLRQSRLYGPGKGANTIWGAELALMTGALAGDSNTVATAAKCIIDELTIGNNEGIQNDFSFYQHRHRLQQFHYGRAFFQNMVRNAWILHGTRWAFSPDKIDLLANYSLEGCAWMSRGRATVPGTLDRAVSRPGALMLGDLRSELRLLAELAPGRATALEAMRRAQQNDEASVRGFRSFPYSDFSAYHNNEYSFFLKTVSTRTEFTEAINNENLKGRKLNWGDHYIVRNGTEYADMPPMWDWNLLPGVTSAADDAVLVKQPFVGAATDGRSGVSAMDYRLENKTGAPLTARKLWAAHDGVVVVLIGALNAEGFAKPIRTAIDQSRQRGDVTIATVSEKTTMETGTREIEGARWLHHAGMLYMPLNTNEPLSLKTGQISGTWKAINVNRPEALLTAGIFLPVIEHGVAPQNRGSGFAFMACATPDNADALIAKTAWKVIRNNTACQAVRFADGTLMVAFYDAGEIRESDANQPLVAASQPCIVLINARGVFVCDPLRTGRDCEITVRGKRRAIACPPDGNTHVSQNF